MKKVLVQKTVPEAARATAQEYIGEGNLAGGSPRIFWCNERDTKTSA